MFVALVLVIGLVNCSPNEQLTENVESVAKCSSACNPPNEAACKKGCLYAYALTLAPKNYVHNPSCAGSCKDTFLNDQERNACNFGCEKFDAHNEEGSVSLSDPDNLMSSFIHHCRRRFSNMFSRLRDLFPHISNADSSVSQLEDPVIRTHVRLIVISPPEDDADSKVEQPRIEDLPFIPRPDGDSEPDQRRRVKSLPTWAFVGQMRHVFTNPLNLLLASTLLVLLILFIAQIVLYARHGRRRSCSYEYTPLPTYAEAIQVKVPLDIADSVQKQKGKPDMDNESVQA